MSLIKCQPVSWTAIEIYHYISLDPFCYNRASAITFLPLDEHFKTAAEQLLALTRQRIATPEVVGLTGEDL